MTPWLQSPTEGLSVEEQVKVIRKIENGKRRKPTWEFVLINSMIQTIWKNRTKIISACEQNGSRKKRFRKPEPSDTA
jgi:hypothetical protein